MAIDKLAKAPPEAFRGAEIRMFRQGFGDCFLVSLHAGQPRPFTMMIDCGLLKGTPGEEKRLAEVAECILELAPAKPGQPDQPDRPDRPDRPKKYVDVLVLSHAHYDQVSGFLPNRAARKIFAGITFGELWLPWTENPKDINALPAKKLHRLRLLALKASVDMQSDQPHPLAAMLDYYGVRGSFERSTVQFESELAIQTAIESVVPDPANQRYWRAGDTFTLPGTGGARVYFLGPANPFDPTVAAPTGAVARPAKRGAVNQEQGRLIAAIERRIGVNKTPKLLEQFGIQPVETWEMHELSIPFERQWRIPARLHEAPADGESSDSDGGKSSPRQLREFVLTDEPIEAKGERRGVSPLAPDAPFDLAVRLDEETNKTSLVMAIELPASGKVLLFPGDAPSSDWKTWRELTWPSKTVNSDEPLCGEQLLGRTVFYKVSQRGCAAGTSAADGLSLLNPDLIAMLPIDRKTARLRGWNLPFPPLWDALRAKTKQRVICSADKPRGGGGDPTPTKLLGPRFSLATIEDRPLRPS